MKEGRHRFRTAALRLLVPSSNRFYPYDLHLRKAKVLIIIGRWPEAEEALRSNWEAASEAGDHRVRDEAALYLGELWRMRGDYAQAWRLFEGMEERLLACNDQKNLPRLYTNLAQACQSQNDYGQAMEYYRKQHDLSQAMGDRIQASNALSSMGSVHYERGEFGQAMKLYQQSMALCEETGDLNSLGMVTCNIGNIYCRLGDYGRALESYHRKLDICHRLGQMRGMSVALGNIGAVHHLRGEYGQAIEFYRRKLDMSTSMGDKVGICYILGNLGNALMELGETDRACDYFQQYLDLSLALGDKLNLSRAYSNLAGIFEARDQSAVAGKYYDKAIGLAQEQSLGQELCEFLLFKARLLLHTADIKGAATLNARASETASKLDSPSASLLVRLQNAEILTHTDPQAAQHLLEALSTENLDDADRALTRYLLYKTTGREEDRLPALDLYRDLCRRAPSVANLRRLSELERPPSVQ
ncbi:MAG: tetratricopeptide repeat protein [Candidatus Edwardsbacteria bacterium]|nr:tetratricopeptide repeat protein [Candidatus Edwardsbacteria bacterium]